MLKKSLLKIGISFLAGMIIGIVLWAKSGWWQAFLILPFYAVGFVYGIQTVLPWIGKFIASCGKNAVYGGCVFKSFWIVLLIIIGLPIGLVFLLLAAWIIGLYHAGAELIRAIRDERKIGHNKTYSHVHQPKQKNSHTNYDTSYDDNNDTNYDDNYDDSYDDSYDDNYDNNYDDNDYGYDDNSDFDL